MLEANGHKGLSRWLRIIGAFYVLQFVAMVIVKAPIKTMGPANALALAASGDELARFVVETWVTFGLEVGAIGVGLLFAARAPEHARPLIWTVIAVEIGRGLIADGYFIATRGSVPAPIAVWLALHSAVIASGLLVLRRPVTATA
jgi:hypothetical protein